MHIRSPLPPGEDLIIQIGHGRTATEQPDGSQNSLLRYALLRHGRIGMRLDSARCSHGRFPMRQAIPNDFTDALRKCISSAKSSARIRWRTRRCREFCEAEIGAQTRVRVLGGIGNNDLDARSMYSIRVDSLQESFV